MSLSPLDDGARNRLNLPAEVRGALVDSVDQASDAGAKGLRRGDVITLANGKTLGAAVIDHPANPPSTWHNARSLWMLNPSISALGPVTIRPTAPLTLRYRVVVHDGPTPTAVVQRLSDEFRNRAN